MLRTGKHQSTQVHTLSISNGASGVATCCNTCGGSASQAQRVYDGLDQGAQRHDEAQDSAQLGDTYLAKFRTQVTKMLKEKQSCVHTEKTQTVSECSCVGCLF